MLRDLQRNFAAAMFEDAPAVEARVQPGRFSAGQHVQVYRHNILGTLTTALGDVYPVVEKLVGGGFFGYAAHEYLRSHRPLAANLHDFGGAFAGFLAGFAPAASLPYLPDVARLEWAWHRAFHAAEAPDFDPAALATVPEERYGRLHFGLHPSAQLVQSDYPVLRIFEVNQEGFTGGPQVDLDGGGEQLLVIRRQLTVSIEPLAAGEYALLNAFVRNQPLDVALDAALAAQPDFDLQSHLQRHVERRSITGFRLD